jgi:hypothetical protein
MIFALSYLLLHAPKLVDRQQPRMLNPAMQTNAGATFHPS